MTLLMDNEQLDRYRTLLRNNAQMVQTFDSLAPLLVSMLPSSRLGDYHLLASEASYALIYSIEAFNKWILHGRTKYQDVLHPQTLAASASAATAHSLRLFLTIIAKIQIVLEIFAHQFGGDRARLNMILLIELAKAVARAMLFRIINSMALNSANQQQKPILVPNGGQYEVDVPVDPNVQRLLGGGNPDTNAAQGEGAASATSAPSTPAKFVGRRSGKVIPVAADLDKYEASRSRSVAGSSASGTPSSSEPSTQLSVTDHEQTRQIYLAGETLNIIRPVVYVLLLEETFSNGSKSWSPWIASLAIDLLSQACTSTSTSILGVSDLAKAEMSRRRSALVFYLMRNPVFDTLVAWVTSNISTGENAGVFSNIINFVIATLRHYHKIHFYVSSS